MSEDDKAIKDKIDAKKQSRKLYLLDEKHNRGQTKISRKGLGY